MDFGQFAALMSARSSNLVKNVNEVKQDVAKKLLETIVEFTPVDTGAAVSNHQIQLNSPADTIIPAHSPGRYRSTADANIRATIAQGDAVIDTAKPGDSIHLTNHIEYIGELDNGSSRQAPAGFSQTAILRARSVVRTAKVVKP